MSQRPATSDPSATRKGIRTGYASRRFMWGHDGDRLPFSVGRATLYRPIETAD